MLNLITNKQEKIEVFSKNADNFYIKCADSLLKNCDIVTIGDDGWFFEIEKPTIKNTIYFDDELESPGKSFEAFFNYNYCYSFFNRFDQWKKDNEEFKKIGCCSGNLLHMPIISNGAQNGQPNRCNVKLYQDYYYEIQNWETQREMSEDEFKNFCEIIEILKEKYIKRLHSYYKKYSHKIYTCGYWANR